MNNKFSTKKLVVLSIFIIINFIGAFLALSLRLPIYIDSIGTITTAIIYGPFYGATVGALTSLLNGFLFDPTSFFYLPVQVLLGLLTGLFFKSKKFEGFKSIFYILIITILGSLLSSLITAFVFSGVTSSGSSYIVAILKNYGISLFSSVFYIQVITDLIDKGLSFLIAFTIIKIIPNRYFY